MTQVQHETRKTGIFTTHVPIPGLGYLFLKQRDREPPEFLETRNLNVGGYHRKSCPVCMQIKPHLMVSHKVEPPMNNTVITLHLGCALLLFSR